MKSLKNNHSNKMNMSKYIGVDVGGTKILAARIFDGKIEASEKILLPKDNGDHTVVIELIKDLILSLLDEQVVAVGIGLPSIVDSEKGVVYDVYNISSWKEVHLVKVLSYYIDLPVYINNDANCYALGEKYFGKGTGSDNMVGLTIGTGLGAGIVKDGKLMLDANGSSGEFGLLPYLDADVETYCSGQFFVNKYKKKGEELLAEAVNGDAIAKNAFQEYGSHLAQAIKMIMLSVDPELIVIGGSVASSKAYFEDSMWDHLKTFPFARSLDKLKIEFSNTNNMAVLGAASLCNQYMDA